MNRSSIQHYLAVISIVLAKVPYFFFVGARSVALTTILDEKYPTVSPDSPAVQIACEMMRHKSSKCYVCEGDRLVGVVKLTEFLNKIFRE